MKIIKKEIYTSIKVEITFTEFWEAFTNLIDDIRADRGAWAITCSPATKKLALEQTEITCELAEEAYANILNHYAVDVIKYIAETNGYRVDHYGMYYRHEKIYRCTFIREGAHME